jgi:hypothetical protein
VTDRSFAIDRDDLLARVDLVAVLDGLSPGTGHGRSRRWHCPSTSHEDNHPSVKVQTDSSGTQRWRCWSGGESGTAIDAVMVARSLPVGEAIRWLNDNYAHLEVLQRRAGPESRPVGQPARVAVEYVARCEKLLWTGSGRPVREWLNRRGLGDHVLRANKVGADPGRRFLPRPKGLPGGWPAAVFPALDRAGNVVYFQARFLEPPDGRDKYDNPSRQHAANPRVAWTSVPDSVEERRGVLVVAEGAPDALIAAQAGFASVAVLGSMYPDGAVADAIAGFVRDNAAAVAVCFDCDVSESGAKGASKLIGLLAERGITDVNNIVPPAGMDLSDWAALTDEWTTAFDRSSVVGVDAAPLRILDAGSGMDLGL